MRALALYYRFAENPTLAKLAGDIREQELARTRNTFDLREFSGVNPDYIDRLEALGISMAAVTAELEAEGVKSFASAWKALMDAMEASRKAASGEE